MVNNKISIQQSLSV